MDYWLQNHGELSLETPPNSHHPTPTHHTTEFDTNANWRETLPKEFDARQKWVDCQSLTTVRDQGSCGSCWAFGSTGAMSDRVCIHSNGKYQNSISPHDLMGCCAYCSAGGQGCDGGDEQDAYHFWATEGIVSGDLYGSGIGMSLFSFLLLPRLLSFLLMSFALLRAKETTYPAVHSRSTPHSHSPLFTRTHAGCQPYPIATSIVHVPGQSQASPTCARSCTNNKWKNPYAQDKVKAKEVYRIPDNDVEAIQYEIMTNGPVSASYEVCTGHTL